MTHSQAYTGHRARSESGSAVGDDGGQQTKALKDKQCPFCHHPFTSSSLGRHLDLYIKPKNPKPPDGIHDVRKIREIRGKITRRQPRNSLKKQEHDDDHDHDLTHSHDHVSRHDDHERSNRGGHDGRDRDYSHERRYDHGRAYARGRTYSYSHERERSESSESSRRQHLPSTESFRVPLPPPGTNHARHLGRLMERDGEMLSPGGVFAGNQDAMQGHQAVRAVFGTANWQGTGVISGLPPYSADMERFQRPMRNSLHYTPTTPTLGRMSTASQLEPNSASQQAGQHSSQNGSREAASQTGRRPQSTVEETEQAAQLALRHVLSSLEAARSASATANWPVSPATLIFDFDYHGQTFPSIVLHVLPSPPTLFSLSPFATHETWPLDPPDEINLNALREHISRRATALASGSAREEGGPTTGAAGNTNSAHNSHGQAWLAQEVARATAHLDAAWRDWARLDAAERKRAWDREVLRAYAQATKRLGDRAAELRVARQQAEYFRRQHERLVRVIETSGLAAGGGPGGPAAKEILAAAATAEPLDVAAEVYEALDRADGEVRDWSYEGLIGRWREKVRLRGGGGRGAGGGGGGEGDAEPQTFTAAPPPVSQGRDHVAADTASMQQPGRNGVDVGVGGGAVGTYLRDGAEEEKKEEEEEPVEELGPGKPRESLRHHAYTEIGQVRQGAVDADIPPGPGPAERDKEDKVNRNGKRARPPSWTDAEAAQDAAREHV